MNIYIYSIAKIRRDCDPTASSEASSSHYGPQVQHPPLLKRRYRLGCDLRRRSIHDSKDMGNKMRKSDKTRNV